MSSYFERNRDIYIQRLSDISKNGDWNKWIEYFLNGVILQAGINTIKADNILNLYNKFKELGYEKETKAVVDRVDEEDRRMIDGKTQSQFGIELGQRGGWIINESGLYSLILGSKLPRAKEFKRWVTSEVLPSIRKHGLYATDELLGNPDFAIAAFTDL